MYYPTITFEAKAIRYDVGEYSACVYEYHDDKLADEIWLGRHPTEGEALDCARQWIAEYWLHMAQTE